MDGLLLSLLFVWHALSPLGLALGAAGGGLLLIAALGLVALPGWLSRPAIVAGGVLLATGLVYQTAYARATHAAELRRLEAVAEQIRQRAAAAEAALAGDRRRAAADAAEIAALKREIDATPRNDADCLPADAADRVRRVR